MYVPDAKQFLHYMTDHKTQGVDAFYHKSLRDVSIGAYLLDPLTGSYPIEKDCRNLCIKGTAVLPGFVWKDSIGDGINAAII